jgi:cytochrome c
MFRSLPDAMLMQVNGARRARQSLDSGQRRHCISFPAAWSTAHSPRHAMRGKKGDDAMKMALVVLAGSVLLCGATGAVAQPAVDAGAAEALTKKSGCMKCHSVTAKKDGPAFKATAEKYKGKADAEKTLYTHLTTNPKIKIDGKEELHESLKTKNDAEIRNVIQYILSR